MLHVVVSNQQKYSRVASCALMNVSELQISEPEPESRHFHVTALLPMDLEPLIRLPISGAPTLQ
jgi:hypothetical protein